MKLSTICEGYYDHGDIVKIHSGAYRGMRGIVISREEYKNNTGTSVVDIELFGNQGAQTTKIQTIPVVYIEKI